MGFNSGFKGLNFPPPQFWLLLKYNIKYTYTVYNKNILKITEIVLNISDIYMMKYILVANVKEDNYAVWKN